MATKSSQKVIPLSPENYVKTKARSLPIGKCYITEDWENGGMANLIITRKHVTGNVTLGFYLIDLYCLGLKDTYFLFNIPPDEFEDILVKFSANTEAPMIECEYKLAHNVIYGGIGFAEDYEFNPHKDFRITQFILEEDSEDVPLIDIAFGKDEKPFIIQSPAMTQREFERYIATLEKTAGAGNYDYIAEVGDDEDEDYIQDNFLGSKLGVGNWNPLPDMLSDFSKGGDLSEIDMIKMADYLFSEFQDNEPNSMERMIADVDITFDLPAEYGLSDDECLDLTDIYCDILKEDNLPKNIGILQAKIAQHPHIPIYKNYLAKAYLTIKNQELYDKVIDEMIAAHPEYLYSKLKLAERFIIIGKHNEVEKVFDNKLFLSQLYPSKKLFHISELITFNCFFINYYLRMGDLMNADLYFQPIKTYLEDIRTTDFNMFMDTSIFITEKKMEALKMNPVFGEA
ncbi:MAG: hypothetical protein HYU69_08885 [Bacteroidetes bacterium]|nr:hypothetical protein [Bacteroidota bacterium]